MWITIQLNSRFLVLMIKPFIFARYFGFTLFCVILCVCSKSAHVWKIIKNSEVTVSDYDFNVRLAKVPDCLLQTKKKQLKYWSIGSASIYCVLGKYLYCVILVIFVYGFFKTRVSIAPPNKILGVIIYFVAVILAQNIRRFHKCKMNFDKSVIFVRIFLNMSGFSLLERWNINFKFY